MVLGPPKVYRPKGQIRQLFDWVDGVSKPPFEVLCEGPRGTGKSRAIGEFLYETAQKYPHTTIVALRRFRADLHKGFQRTFEDMVLYPGHPLLTRVGGGKDANRETYQWPNGSRLLLGHMEDAQRWYSAEFDILYWNEAKECKFDQWDRLTGSMRKGERLTQCPFRMKIADTNPDAPKHWLNVRAREGKMLRIVTKHRDNPSLEPEYLENLRSLSGVRYRRDYLGEWCAAEGRIWDCFDPDFHVIERTPPLAWYVAGMDFGYSAPGCLLVCGFDANGIGYVVREVYRRGMHLEWWADQILELHEQFHLSMIVADSAEPRSIDWLNERLQLASSRGDAMVHGVTKKKNAQGKSFVFASNEHVRSLFQEGQLFVLEDMQRMFGGPDPELTGVARCLTDEIDEYVYRTAPEGRELQTAQREDVDPTCADHACAALRYLASEAWAADFTPGIPDSGLPDCSMAAELGHAEVWAASTRGGDSTFDDYTTRRQSRPGAFRRRRY